VRDSDLIAEARDLMLSFADRTGIGSGRTPRRYLWTDAFAVCNFVGLWRATGEQRYLELARALVDQVHDVLGRHRGDDGRRGWLSGLDDEAARAHPTAGGLRIGKPLPERRLSEPFDERLEWERDGQYFHYLTRWMHALAQVERATRERRFDVWARELAARAHQAFTGGRLGHMYWKMSIDLSRPAVPAMGQHDPLDGLVTCAELVATAEELGGASEGPGLGSELADLSQMAAHTELETLDPLGIGGLLVDAARIAQLMERGVFTDGELLHRVVDAALVGLRLYASSTETLEPAAHRLAFRELGLVMGLEGARIAHVSTKDKGRPSTSSRLEHILGYAAFADSIRDFWRSPAHRATQSWLAHEDINDVMLATCLAPAGYLVFAR